MGPVIVSLGGRPFNKRDEKWSTAMAFRRFLKVILISLALAVPLSSAHGATDVDPRMAAEGFHMQPWQKVTTLDLNKDLARAKSEGRILVLMWEQLGCVYCAEMHNVNFKIPRIADYIKKNFYVVQMNLWGERLFRDFDGEQMSEEELARRHRVSGTPTLEYRKSAVKEAFRMPGYADPPIFLGVFEYVATGGYETASVNDWFRRNAKRLRDAWDDTAVN
jgi:thioredoxin-related protein